MPHGGEDWCWDLIEEFPRFKDAAQFAAVSPIAERIRTERNGSLVTLWEITE